MSKKDEQITGLLTLIALGILFFPIALIIGIFVLIFYLVGKSERFKTYNKFIMENETREILQQVDFFDGHKFEQFVAEILYKNKYTKIEVTRGSGDYGADIIAEKDNTKYAFQCKRFNSTIGPKPIGEVLRGMQYYNCNKGIVVTNNYFSKQALREGKICNIELWDRDKLAMLIQGAKHIKKNT